MIYTIERKLAFDAGHRLLNHEGKCKYPHGHHYTVTVSVAPLTVPKLVPVSGSVLDSVGRVIDFSVVKERLGGWIDHYWDHNMILNRDDTEMITGIGHLCKHGEPYLLDCNPTAENLAAYLLEVVCATKFTDVGVKVVAIRVDETPNCSAIVEEENNGTNSRG